MKVKELLDEKGVWYRIIELSTPGKSSEQFAEQLEEDSKIAKTIVMKVEDKFLAFLVPKDHLVDYKKLKVHFGTKKLRMANPEEVLEHSTSTPGACCPLLVDCKIYFDPCLSDWDDIYLGSGDVMKGLVMKTKDLRNIVNPEFLEVSVPK